MCLIVASRTSLPELEELKMGWKYNPDGWGVSYGKKLLTFQGLDWSSFEQNWKNVKPPFMVHFRWATHGAKGLHNCHPFSVGHGTMMAHNGILDTPIIFQEYSDTWHFANMLKSSVSRAEGFHKKSFRKSLSATIGSNKLTFMSNGGLLSIVNEELGGWDKGIWYSNYNHRWTAPSSCSSYSSYYREDDYFDDSRCCLCLNFFKPEDLFEEVCFQCAEENGLYMVQKHGYRYGFKP